MIKVKVYWNLHKKCYSVQHRGKVIKHTDAITIHDPEFRVSESGRQRVLMEKRKNVHAFIVGMYSDDSIPSSDYEGHLVTYNPYKYETFVFADTEESIYSASIANCMTVNGKGLIYV